MASSSLVKFVCLFLVCMIMGAHNAIAAISCGQVVSNLRPCISYVSSGGAVPKSCCDGVKTLYGAAQSTPDRQAVCRCLKQAINGIAYSPINVRLAAGLPGKCGVNLPYKIDPSTNCDNVK